MGYSERKDDILRDEFSFIDEIKNEKTIIVYSDTPIAYAVVECLEANGLRHKIRVAGFPIMHGRRLLRYKVEDIRTLKDIAKECAVIIAVNTKFHKEVEESLKEIGFDRFIRVNSDLLNNLYLRYDPRTLDIERKKQLPLQYKSNNLVKLNHIRNKVLSNKKIRVLFIVTSKTKFNFASVYKAMESKKIFDISIFHVCDNLYDCSDSQQWNEAENHATELKEKGYSVIWGYDDDNNPISIDSLFPDIVFYNTPNLINAKSGFSIHKIIIDYLACYISYGVHVSNNEEYHFEHENILPAWVHFIDTRPAYNMCVNNPLNRGLNALLSGYPEMDEYVATLDKTQYAKIVNGCKTIVIAPHWSIGSWNDTSSFHIYFQYFIDLLDRHPDINFVFKPHPKLRLEVQTRKTEDGMSSLAEYDAYCKRWDDAPNGMVVTDSSYIDLFRISDCLITDSYSFLVSWLPTDKPCIIPINPRVTGDYLNRYYDFVHPVISAYYKPKTEDEIDQLIIDIIKAGNDPKAEERQKVKNDLLYNVGSAGQFIADYIETMLV